MLDTKKAFESAIKYDNLPYFKELCEYKKVRFVNDPAYLLLMFNLLKYEYQVINRRQRDIGLESGFAVDIKRQTNRTWYNEIAKKFSYICEAAENFKEHREVNYLMVLMLDEEQWYKKFFPNFYYKEHPDECEQIMITANRNDDSPYTVLCIGED